MSHLNSPDERFLLNLKHVVESTDTYQLKDAIRSLLFDTEGVGAVLDNMDASAILDYVEQEKLLQYPNNTEYTPDQFFTESDIIDAASEALDDDNLTLLESIFSSHVVDYYQKRAPNSDRVDFFTSIDPVAMINEIEDYDKLKAMRDRLNEILDDDTGWKP